MVRRKSTSTKNNTTNLNKSSYNSASNSKNASHQESKEITGKTHTMHTTRVNQQLKILREIRHLQKSTKLQIPKQPFSRLVHEILQERAHHHLRITSEALAALHESVEMYLVQFFEDSYRCALHARRKTLKCQDMHLVRYLRGPGEIVNK